MYKKNINNILIQKILVSGIYYFSVEPTAAETSSSSTATQKRALVGT